MVWELIGDQYHYRLRSFLRWDHIRFLFPNLIPRHLPPASNMAPITIRIPHNSDLALLPTPFIPILQRKMPLVHIRTRSPIQLRPTHTRAKRPRIFCMQEKRSLQLRASIEPSKVGGAATDTVMVMGNGSAVLIISRRTTIQNQKHHPMRMTSPPRN